MHPVVCQVVFLFFVSLRGPVCAVTILLKTLAQHASTSRTSYAAAEWTNNQTFSSFFWNFGSFNIHSQLLSLKPIRASGRLQRIQFTKCSRLSARGNLKKVGTQNRNTITHHRFNLNNPPIKFVTNWSANGSKRNPCATIRVPARVIRGVPQQFTVGVKKGAEAEMADICYSGAISPSGLRPPESRSPICLVRGKQRNERKIKGKFSFFGSDTSPLVTRQ